MKNKILWIFLLFFTYGLYLSGAPKKMDIDRVRCASEKDYQWWREARFGIFIHWGPGAFVNANSLGRLPQKGTKGDLVLLDTGYAR